MKLAGMIEASLSSLRRTKGGAMGERDHVQRAGRSQRPSEGKRAVV